MAWEEAIEVGSAHGYHNAQATVLAPKGCLVEGSLVSTSRGLVRLGTLGNVDGAEVAGSRRPGPTRRPRAATKFDVNGSSRSSRCRPPWLPHPGHADHRIKVVDSDGNWVWKRMAEIAAGDRVPMMLNSLVGEPQTVALPPLETCTGTPITGRASRAR